MKYFLLIPLILSWFFGTQNLNGATEGKADSIKRQIAVLKSKGIKDSSYTTSLINLANELQGKASQDAIFYLEEAKNIFLSQNNLSGVVTAYNRIGHVYLTEDLQYLALDNFYKGYEIARANGYKVMEGYSLTDIGTTFYNQKLYENAKEFYLQVLTLFTESKNEYGMSVAENNLGLVYRNTGKLDSAEIHFKEGLKLRKILGNRVHVAHNLNYLASVKLLQKDFDAAFGYYSAAKTLLINSTGNTDDIQYLLAQSNLGLAKVDISQSKYTEAISLLNESLNNADSSGQEVQKPEIFSLLSEIHATNKIYNKALTYADSALNIATRKRLLDEKRSLYLQLSKIYLNLDNKAKAVEYFDKYTSISDSLIDHNLTRKLSDIQTAIKISGKEKDLELIKQSQHNINIQLVGMAFILLLIFGIILYRIKQRAILDRRLSQLANATLEGILIHDKGVILDGNHALRKLLGISEDTKLSELKLFDFVAEEDFEIVIKELNSTEESDYFIRVKRLDGTYIHVEIVSKPYEYSSKTARVVAIRDISQKIEAERLVKLSEENLRTLINNTTDLIWSVDSNFNIVKFNDAFAKRIKELFGKEVVEGMSVFSDISVANNVNWIQLYQDALSGTRSQIEYCVKINGSTIYYDASVSPVLLNEKIQGISVFMRDITERKEYEDTLKKSEDLTRRIVDIMPLPFVATKVSTGEIILYNKQFLKTFNLTKEDLVNTSILDFYHNPNDREFLVNDALKNGYAQELELKFKQKNGVDFWALISTVVMTIDNELIMLSGVFDISDRKKTEEMLVRAKEDSDAASKSKSEFIANMSHEIRTPLNAIIGFTNLLHDKYNEPKAVQYLMGIEHASKNLLQLMNDILDLSKIEFGKLLMQENKINLLRFINDINGLYSFQATIKNISFIIELDPLLPLFLVGDETRLRQIIFNLIGNAIKFTSKGNVRLKFALHNYIDSTKIKLKVQSIDTGIGIKRESIPTIFIPFKQVESGISRKFDGTGLGLAITNKLIELLDGEIEVDSIEGEGSTFTVVLNSFSRVVSPEYELKHITELENSNFVPQLNLVYIPEIHEYIDNFVAMLRNSISRALINVCSNESELIVGIPTFYLVYSDQGIQAPPPINDKDISSTLVISSENILESTYNAMRAISTIVKDLLEENSADDETIFPDFQKTVITPEQSVELERIFGSHIEELLNAMVIDEIIDFANNLIEYAEVNALTSLKYHAVIIKDSAGDFSYDRIALSLNDLRDYIRNLHK